MPSLTSILFLVYGLVALVAASPTPHMVQKRGVFKVDRVRNPNPIRRNGPRALLKTLRKYRMTVPASLLSAVENQEELISKREPRRKGMPNGATGDVSAAANGRKGKGRGKKGKGNAGAGAAAGAGAGAAAGADLAPQQTATANTNGTGLVVNTPEANDVEYLSPVNIGGQVVNLDFDTGSSDLWVFNTQLSGAATDGHALFDPSSSATFKLMQNAQFQISYGDGSGAEGNVGTDVVNIGGAEVKAQAVELATAVSQSFIDDTATDGLLGLAFSTINTVQPQQQKTFFDNVMSSLEEPLFTADLRAGANGAYEFGTIDTSKFTGDMTFVAVNNTQGFWQFTSDQFAVDGGKAQTSVAGNQAIADTGTTLLLADPAVATAYYAQVDGAQNDAQQGGFTIPCDATLPDLQVAIGDAMATVKGTDLNFAPVDAAGTTCFGGLQAGESGGLQIYGDIFFKSNFVVFNGGNTTLGFAQHA
ncbi:aspartic peptidase domain-containing protein [Hypoxylon argillaceum]|nr:aspartic peptidase domain-containing protein [Hypoxylon argillaceum]KAI1155585.1 aspartic peptidase domain-containing protein [Nemania diffusa]